MALLLILAFNSVLSCNRISSDLIQINTTLTSPCKIRNMKSVDLKYNPTLVWEQKCVFSTALFQQNDSICVSSGRCSKKVEMVQLSNVILSGWTLMYHVDRLAAKVQLSKLAHLAWHRFRQRSFPTAWRCAQNINCASCLWIPALKRAPFSLKYDYLWGL